MFVRGPNAPSTLCYLFALTVIPGCGGESGSGTDVDGRQAEPLRRPLAVIGELQPHDGAKLGAVEAPRGFRLLAATADRWWGSMTDELDVPYIVRYDIGPATIETALSG